MPRLESALRAEKSLYPSKGPSTPSEETDADFLRRLLIEPSPGRAAVLLAHLGILRHHPDEGLTGTLGARTFDAESGRLSLHLADGRIVELELVSHPDSEEGFAVNIRSRAGQLVTHGFLRIDRDSGAGPRHHRMVYLKDAREAHDAQIYASSPYDDEGEVEYLDPPPDQPDSEFIPDAHIESHAESTLGARADAYPGIHFADPLADPAIAARLVAPAAFEPEEEEPEEEEPEEEMAMEETGSDLARLEAAEPEQLAPEQLEPVQLEPAETFSADAEPEPADSIQPTARQTAAASSDSIQSPPEASHAEAAPLASGEAEATPTVPSENPEDDQSKSLADEAILTTQTTAAPEALTPESIAPEPQQPEAFAPELPESLAAESEPSGVLAAEPGLASDSLPIAPSDHESDDAPPQRLEPQRTHLPEPEAQAVESPEPEQSGEPAAPELIEPEAQAVETLEPDLQAFASGEPAAQESADLESGAQAVPSPELEAHEPEFPDSEPVPLDPEDLEHAPPQPEPEPEPDPVVTFASANLRARYYAPLHRAFTPDQAELFDWVAETDTIQTYEHRGTLRYLHIDSETGHFYNQRREQITRESALLHVMPPPPPIEPPVIESAPVQVAPPKTIQEPPHDLKLAVHEKKVQKPTRFALQVDPPPEPNPLEPALDAFTRKHSLHDERDSWRNRIAVLGRWRAARNGQKSPEDS